MVDSASLGFVFHLLYKLWLVPHFEWGWAGASWAGCVNSPPPCYNAASEEKRKGLAIGGGGGGREEAAAATEAALQYLGSNLIFAHTQLEGEEERC